MGTIHEKIKAYKYNDAKRGLYTTVVGNALLFLCIALSSTASSNIHASLSILSAIAIFILIMTYDWKSRSLNLFIIGVYLGVFLWEFFVLGTAGVSVFYPVEKYQISKGVMFDLLVWSLPSIYMGIRLLLIIPLGSMVYLNWKSLKA